jgi:hypothetical protein
MRDKKIASEPMTYIRKKDFPFNVSSRTLHLCVCFGYGLIVSPVASVNVSVWDTGGP